MLKAVRFSQFGGPEVLEIVDLPDPHPGPGQVRIAVRAAGVNPSDWKKRKGLMDAELPQTMGHEAAGVVDELGEGVADMAAGDRVFGFSAEGAAQAELAVLSSYAPIPPSLDFPGAAALPAAIETATRALDQLGVGSGSTLLINGASGSVGSAAVQLAVVRGARVIGTASPANHDYLRSLRAEPVAYGEGLAGRVRALAPDGVDAALDVAGSGVLPELTELAGGPEHVVTIALHRGDRVHRVRAAQQFVVHLGQAQVADLALGHELGHRADGLLDLGRLRRAVQVVQVDDLDAEPGQRRLAGPLHVVVLAADDAVRVARRPVDAELGSQLHLVAPVRDAPADQDLVVARAVDVGGVDERHAQVERAIDGDDRLVPVGGAVPLAHPHAAQSLGGHGEIAEFGGAHVCVPVPLRIRRPGSCRSG